MLEKGGPALWLLVLAAAGFSAIAGLYGLSGAGLLPRLPALRAALIVIGCGFTQCGDCGWRS